MLQSAGVLSLAAALPSIGNAQSNLRGVTLRAATYKGGHKTLLEAAGLACEDSSLLLRRTVDIQGRSRAWINGAPATATQLRHLGDALLDIHGQHAWQSLTRPEAVRELLDAYAGVDTQSLRAHWTAWRAAHKNLEHALAAQDTLQRERERLQWQIGELDKLSPGTDEWEELNTQHTRLSHAQSLLETALGTLHLLEDDETGITSPLTRAHSTLQHQEHLEPEFLAIADVLASSLAQVNDARHSLHSYLRRTELDPERLAELDGRLTLWMQLARRYKRTPQELPGLLQSWRDELRQLDAVVDVAQLRHKEQQAQEAYHTAARALSLQRAKAAPKLSRAITQAMQGLGMQGGKFAVQLDGGEALAMREHPHDLWLRAVPGSEPLLAFGLAGCSVELPLAAVTLAQVVPLVSAVLQLFLEMADVQQTRMRHLLAEIGITRFVEALQARLPFALRAVTDEVEQPSASGVPLGAHVQRQNDLHMLVAGAPLGRIEARQLLALADLVEREGDGQLRLTPWQGVLLPNIPAAASSRVLQALGELGLVVDRHEPLGQLLACTGSPACAKGLADTKADARRLATLLTAQGRAPQVHLCGCPRSCAAAHVAAFTLLAQPGGDYQLYQRAPDAAGFGRLLAPSLSLEEAGAWFAAQPESGIPHD